MNTSDTLAFGHSLNTQIGGAPTTERSHPCLLTPGVANPFEMRSTELSEAHDRIRTELLARHPPRVR
jgi:hypothetical protein